MEQALLALGHRMNFQEIQALRAFTFDAHGLRLPERSAESLENFLDLLWGQWRRFLIEGLTAANLAERQTLQSVARARSRGITVTDDEVRLYVEEARRVASRQGIYNLYNRVSGAAPLTRGSQSFLDELARVARARNPPSARTTVQRLTGQPGRGDEFSPLVARQTSGNDMGLDHTYIHFIRDGFDPITQSTMVQERVYLNVAPDAAPEFMGRIVREMVDNPREFPGTFAAKIRGPGAAPQSSDTIVIFVRDQAEAQRVVQRVRQLQEANPAVFRRDTPYMTEQVMEGVSLGAEPVGAVGESFGTLRSTAIWEALEGLPPNANRAQFGDLVRERLRRYLVAPNAPHRNFPGAGGP